MKRKINIIGITLFFTLALFSLAFSEESLTITTYYPSPYGSYNELYVAGNVGIGTTVPNAKLEVAGTLRVTPGLIEGYGSQMTLRSYGILDLIVNYDGSVGQGEHIRFFGPGGATELMRIQDNGNVGIGTTSPGSYKLYVNGTTWCTSGAWSGSDLRWKENILTLSDPLDKIAKLRGVEFDWKQREFEANNFPAGRQIGIIAQEMEKEFPELITTDPQGYKAVAYDRFSAVLLEAIKAQQREIEELKEEIKLLKEKK